MRLTRGRQRSDAFEVVVTSMLDINFLLIMFFMMTAQFQKENRAELQLPPEHGEREAEHDEAGLVINITNRGEIVVSHDPITMDELKRRGEAENASRPSGAAEA